MKISRGILIVGYGKHVENKILPAIRELNIPLLGVVSSNKNVPKELIHYKNLKEIKDLLKPSHIFIASDPLKHLNLIQEASNFSKNLLVEKPILIQNPNILQSKEFKNLEVTVKEAMMYKYNYLNIFLEKKKKSEGFKNIDVEFILPLDGLKNNRTFRSSPNFENSMLFDLGCYIFDFIWTFKLLSYKLSLQEKTSFDDGQAKFVFLKSENINDQNLSFKFGYGKNYSNFVKITTHQDILYELGPFFYGRSSELNINISKNNKIYNEIHNNENCFVKMISEWYLNKNSKVQHQLSNFKRITYIYNSLNQLSKNWRAHV
jgi:hypothetical protein